MANWHDRPATAALYLAICLLTIALRLTSALPTVPGSSCESVCTNAGDLVQDVVCLDADYQNLENGRAYQKCVSCQLNSTAVDTGKNETDVEFGLLALRYTLAGCMFAIPQPHISISSPCQVSCATLNSSIGYEITNDSSTNSASNNDFCHTGHFPDSVINTCAFCYSFIPQQLFLANFLQALHINCVQPHVAGRPFFPDANAIFNETLIAGPAPLSSGSASGGGLHGYQLALAIALPIVGGILIIGSTCWCCFIFTRKRRQKMAATGRMSKVHDANLDQMYTPVSPSMKNAEAWGQGEPPREMHAISPTLLHAKHPSPGLAQGRWSHQTGGSEQGTPLRDSFQQDDVGPGSNQVRDPNLHNLYFGVDEEPRETSGPSTTNGQYYDQQSSLHHPEHETKGHFI